MGLLSWLRGERGTRRPEGPPAPPPPADRFDVVELPPIQRTLTVPTLVTDPSAFERGLPTRRPTALSTPLGHLVSAEAPGGVVQGVTTPVQRSVVRFPARGGDGPPAVAAGTADPVPVRPPVQRALSVPTPARTPSAPTPEAPGRTAGTASPANPANPASAAIQRTYEPPPVRGESTGDIDRAVSAAHATGGPDAPESSGPLAAEPATEAAAEPSVVRPLVGEQPLLDTPAPPETGPDAVPGTVPPPVQRSLPPAAPTSASPPAPRRAPGLGAPLPALPPTAQREAHTPAPAPAPLPVPADALPPPLATPTPAPEPEPAPEPVAPLLADRPLVLRTVSAEPAPVAAGTGGAGAPPQVPAAAPPAVPVRWETPAPAVQRRTPVPSTPTPSTPTPATTVQRATARPAVPSAPLTPPPPRDAGDVAVAAGIAQRMADGSVVFAPPPPVRRPASPAPFVQREVATEEPPPPEDTPSAAAPEPLPDPPPDAPSDPGADSPDDAPRGASGGAPGGAPPVTDEFVRALYPSLARLLKAELRLERERAGRLIDTRFRF
ncbi:hypothetical protein ABZ615_21685 [Streptomyces sp. NPDC007325]|uniref:hypothetical protein n=1 Tax=Streptomyces sp. NPDC007325 TaxID=3154588 RepID=UPI0033DFF81F